ncbi:4-alpha-glucanotransferase [Bifidobacterium bifidum]|nr:4-alpha-glucanotransferase [Bifidobacterium bifidum]
MSWLGWRRCGGSHKIAGCLLRLTCLLRLLLLLQGLSLLLQHEADIIDALYRALKGSPCKLLAASITDAVGEKRAQNQPGTNNEYPNWRIPLADDKGNVVPLETLFDTPGAQRFAQIFNN